MTLDYYTYEIRSILKERHDDSHLDDRLITRWINSQRALWIKNQVNNEYSLEDTILQTIPCLEVEVASEAECNLFNSQGRLFRTRLPVPKPLEFKDRLGIMDVRAPELTGYSLNPSTRESIKFAGNGRFNKQDIFYFIYGGYLYFKVPELNFKAALLTHLAYEAVLENPLAAEAYYTCDNKPCFNSQTDDYPISDAMWEYVQGQLIQNKFGLMGQMRDKPENDENPDT
jgi:hypothetical protein